MPIPTFSIIISTHLRAPYLSRALQSLRAQTLTDFEIILVSDVYDLDTIEAAKRYLIAVDTLVLNPNLVGPAESRNLGVSLAKGDWIMFLDDDDAYSTNYLDQLPPRIRQGINRIFYTNYIKVREDRESGKLLETTRYQIGPVHEDQILIGNFIANSAVIVESTIAKRVSFDRKLASHEDWDWLIQISEYGKFEYLDIDGPIIYESVKQSRNNDSVRSKAALLDYLTIYRKWKTAKPNVADARETFLLSNGVPRALAKLAAAGSSPD